MKKEIEEILDERFGKDSLIALATVNDGLPCVRTVDGFYEDGYFYVLTYALSNKMIQIAKEPRVAISGEWFTANGVARNRGWFCLEENKHIASKMKEVFSAWIDNGHNNFDDPNTCVLQIELTTGILFSNGNRYDIDFRVKS